jgi:hypothetical protein
MANDSSSWAKQAKSKMTAFSSAKFASSVPDASKEPLLIPDLDKKDLLIVIVLILLCALFFWRMFVPDPQDQVMIPLGDFSYQFYAWRVMIFQELRQGRFPLWTDNIYSGYPLQADPQSAMFYPPALVINLSALLLGLERFPFRLLELEVVAHVFLSSLFMYFFLRSQLKKRTSALLGSIVFAYGGYLTSYPLQQMAILEAATWLPLALWGIWLRYRRQRNQGLWLTAFALGVSILAGHPQTSMLVLYTTVGYQIYQLYRARERWYTGLRDIGLMVVVAVALSAVQALPSWQYMQLSTRADLPINVAGSGFPLADLLQFVLTGLVSLWHPLYIGIWPLFLVYLALTKPQRSDAWFWLGLSLIGLLLSFGKQFISFDLAYLLLPGYRLFRSQERSAFLVSFGLSVLAAYGADMLWTALSQSGRARVHRLERFLRRTLPLALGALFVLMLFHRQGIDPSESGNLPHHAALFVLMLAGSWSLIHARYRESRKRNWWSWLSVGLVVLNLFAVNRTVNQAPMEEIYPLTPPIQFMLNDPALFRFQDDHRLRRHIASIFDLQQVRGISPIRPAHYQTFLDEAPEAVRWQLLNVKYVVTWRGNLVTRDGIEIPADLLFKEGEAGDEDVLYLYRIREPGPRAWIVHGTYFARNQNELYAYMNLPYFDPSRAAAVTSPLALPTAEADTQDHIRVIDYTPMRIQLEAELEVEGLLVLSEVNYPGWRAFIDGRPAPVEEAYGILRSVVVPAGQSTVEFRYQPTLFYVGALISGATWLLLLGVLIKGLAQRNRS